MNVPSTTQSGTGNSDSRSKIYSLRVSVDVKVDLKDLKLPAMTGLHETRVHAKLREIQPNGQNAEEISTALRTYFYNKYIYTNPPMKNGD